ncbi:MAG: type II toxin-antitoxin system RelE/ParE family toxin [Planctomycetota bacterium]
MRKTALFTAWIDNLRDFKSRACILARIERLAAGHARDVKPVGEGVSEMRIDTCPGHRVYYVKHGVEWIILLAGGDMETNI